MTVRAAMWKLGFNAEWNVGVAWCLGMFDYIFMLVAVVWDPLVTFFFPLSFLLLVFPATCLEHSLCSIEVSGSSDGSWRVWWAWRSLLSVIVPLFCRGIISQHSLSILFQGNIFIYFLWVKLFGLTRPSCPSELVWSNSLVLFLV